MPLDPMTYPISFRIDKQLLEKFDKIWKRLEYPSRAFYIRKLIKKVVEFDE